METTEIIEQTIGDADICVAVLDGPVDLTHPCFKKAKLSQLETLVSGVADEGPSAHHGTHVASLIFGQPGSLIRGISPGCRGLIIPIFADGPDDSLAPCSQIDLAHAITQAVEQGAHVINISGGELVSSGEPHPLLDKAVRLCAENGVLIVAAVGNDGCQCLHIPAAVSSTLAVGAMDAQGLPLDFSNWGESYQTNGILAPGEKLLGAVPGSGVTTKSGTSFATPIVSGIVALLLSIQIQRGDKPDPYAVRAAILESAHPCSPSEALDCSHYLRGRLNIGGAYNLITKRQQAVTECNNSVQQIQGSACTGLVESSKRLPVLGVQNAEFTTPNPEIATPSTQRSTFNAMKALENADSIGLKSIEKEKNKQTKNQIMEENMNELIDETCGCPTNQTTKEETNELNDQTSDGTEITVPNIHASDVQAAEPTITTQEVATPPHVSSTVEAPLTMENTPSVMPTQVHPSQAVGEPSLVYALGILGYDFGTEARRDAFVQSMEGTSPNPDDPEQLLAHLEANPEYAASLIWTLELEATPIYAIFPFGTYDDVVYKRLREFLKAQLDENVEQISVPGVIRGSAKLSNGQKVPVIIPELRGMYSWSTDVLLGKLSGVDEAGVRNFLERVYYELMNLGRISQERAMNFAATNAFQVAAVFEQAAGQNLMLDRIETERSPVCRPDSDCWDVKLTFFDPANRLTVARKVYRFTVDVSDVVPVSVGTVRSWAVY